MILPRPTNGETTLPNKNPDAPKIAEPVPACFLAASIAIDVATVNDMPKNRHNKNNKISKKYIAIPKGMDTAKSKLQAVMPAQLVFKQCPVELNLTFTR